MFRRCAIDRWTCTRPSLSTSSTPRTILRRTITTVQETQHSPNSQIPPKPRAWRQLVALALVGIPGSFIAYYFLDQESTSPESFAKYKLTLKEPVSSSAAIFHIEPQNAVQESARYKEIWRQGIWNVQFKQPQLQILRAYTPLPPIPSNDGRLYGTDNLRFLIRNDPQGEVSGYLHRLPVGSTVELRGPSLEHTIGKDVKDVVFLAGGTGIAPALQVAHAMFDGHSAAEVQDKRLHILWANRKKEDCAGVNTSLGNSNAMTGSSSWKDWFSWNTESNNTADTPTPQATAVREQSVVENGIVWHLSALQARYPGQVTVSYFVDEDNTRIDTKAISHALSRSSKGSETGTSSGQREIIISGPPGFIGYLAGPKVWQNGIEDQGPLRGLVGVELARTHELKNVRVWKV